MNGTYGKSSQSAKDTAINISNSKIPGGVFEPPQLLQIEKNKFLINQ